MDIGLGVALGVGSGVGLCLSAGVGAYLAEGEVQMAAESAQQLSSSPQVQQTIKSSGATCSFIFLVLLQPRPNRFQKPFLVISREFVAGFAWLL